MSIIETIWDPLKGTLAFRVRAGVHLSVYEQKPRGWVHGGAILPSLSNFPPGASMRPFAFLCGRHTGPLDFLMRKPCCMAMLWGDDDEDFWADDEEQPGVSGNKNSGRSKSKGRRKKK